MEIRQIRRHRDAKSTISDQYINGNHFGHILEDPDRGLYSAWPLALILKKKIAGDTAIPYGRYEVIPKHSPHFDRIMPHLKDIPGFDDTVMYHWGNSDKDTKGCQITGQWKGGSDWITTSHDYFDAFNEIIERAWARGEQIWVSIEPDDGIPIVIT